jgi:hypothetical protein
MNDHLFLRRQINFLRACACISLIFCIGPAFPEWTRIGSTSEETIYIDFSTVKKTKHGTRRAWFLSDYDEPATYSGGKTTLSDIQLEELDCDEEAIRTLSYSHFSDHMGAGKVVISSSSVAWGWRYVFPGSIGRKMLIQACSIKH